MKDAAYLGHADLEREIQGLKQNHIFSIKGKGNEQYVIVHEWKWGEYTLHTISDNLETIKKYIKK